MAGFLSGILAPLAQAAGQGYLGYGEDKQDALKQAALEVQAKRQAQNDEIANALKAAETARANKETSLLGAVKPQRQFQNGQLIDLDTGTATPVAGYQAPVTAPVLGTPEHLAAITAEERAKAKIAAENRPPEKGQYDSVRGGFVTPGQPFQPVEQLPDRPKSESAMNVAANARLQSAVSEMNNAHAGMDDFENKLASGKISINGLQQFMGAVGNSFTHDDPVSRAVQSTALSALNTSNPELARYIRRGLSFAEGESMISQRPSDFRTKMAAFLSTAASGASPDMIHDIQSRRNSIIVPLNATVGNKQTTAPAPSGGKALTPAQYQAARAHYTDAEIQAQGYKIPQED